MKVYNRTAQHSTAYIILKKIIKKVFYVRWDYVFGINIFSKCVFSVANHYIISFKTEDYNNIHDPVIKVSLQKITRDNVKNIGSESIKYYLNEHPKISEGFYLRTEDNKPVGHVGILYNGGTRLAFHLKTIDALLFDVFICEDFRRKGLCEYMIKRVLQYLHDEKHIDKAYLAVRRNNHPARRAYDKIGGKIESRKISIRVCKIPIPLRGHNL